MWSSNSATGLVAIQRNLNQYVKETSYMHVYCNIIHNTQDMESIWVCIHRWMDKEDVDVSASTATKKKKM
jgi:hypothetical protein